MTDEAETQSEQPAVTAEAAPAPRKQKSPSATDVTADATPEAVEEPEVVPAPPTEASRAAAREHLDMRIGELSAFVQAELANFDGDVDAVIAKVSARLKAI